MPSDLTTCTIHEARPSVSPNSQQSLGSQASITFVATAVNGTFTVSVASAPRDAASANQVGHKTRLLFIPKTGYRQSKPDTSKPQARTNRYIKDETNKTMRSLSVRGTTIGQTRSGPAYRSNTSCTCLPLNKNEHRNQRLIWHGIPRYSPLTSVDTKPQNRLGNQPG